MIEAKEFVALIADAIEKGIFEMPEGTGRLQMFAKGTYVSGERYLPGDVVTVIGVGMFICLEETVTDPRSNSSGWLVLSAIAQGGYGGGSGSGSVTPPTPAFNYVSHVTGENDNNLGGFETLTLTFDSPPAIGTLSAPSDADGNPVAGSWTISGVSATFTPGSFFWETLPSPFTISTAGITGTNGTMISNPQTFSINVEFPAGSFSLDEVVTSGVDGEVYDKDTITLKFTAPIGDYGTMPAWFDNDGTTIGGTWYSVIGGFQFIPAMNWQDFTSPFRLDLSSHVNTAGLPLINAQFVTVNLEGYVAPTKPMFFLGMVTQSGVANAAIVGTREKIVAQFNRPVSPASISTTVVTSSDTGLVIPGSWAIFGNDAWFTPTANWPSVGTTTPAIIFTFNGVVAADNGDALQGVDANGDLIHRFALATFTYVADGTGEGDFNLFDKESFFLEFDSVPDISTVPFFVDSGGTEILGTWTLSGNTVTFVPANNWQDFVEPFTIETFNIRGVNGAPTSFGPTISLNLESLVKVDHAPSSITPLSYRMPISITFNDATSLTVNPFVTQDGMIKNGVWTASGGSVFTFVPDADWAPGASVSLNWFGVTDDRGRVVSNPGLASWSVLDQFLFTGSSPADDGLAGAVRFAGYVMQGPAFILGVVTISFNKDVTAGTLPRPTIGGSPVSGTWSGSGNMAYFQPDSAMPAGADLVVNYSNAMSTTGLPLSNPGVINLRIVAKISQQFVLPAPGTSFRGTSQILIQFDGPCELQTMALPVVVQGVIPVPVAGVWEALGNSARFTPSSTWPIGTCVINSSGANSLAGQQVLNPQSMQWTTTA